MYIEIWRHDNGQLFGLLGFVESFTGRTGSILQLQRWTTFKIPLVLIVHTCDSPRYCSTTNVLVITILQTHKTLKFTNLRTLYLWLALCMSMSLLFGGTKCFSLNCAHLRFITLRFYDNSVCDYNITNSQNINCNCCLEARKKNSIHLSNIFYFIFKNILGDQFIYENQDVVSWEAINRSKFQK